ncbi:unnamed protein product [Enterobius vermicularis]|uniref:C-type lectin domain-containing protein n=1 Tax=Enterobius vermicularis TaxID=51028 RepID=A0A0N4VJX2_ENTVE|nr:unnamed protein product [Enterobius vermicularis]
MYFSPLTKTCRNTLRAQHENEELEPPQVDLCDPGWSRLENKCYKVHLCGGCTWTETNECPLASIHSDKENMFVTDLVRRSGVDSWIGAIRLTFGIDDITLTSYFNWDRGEPSSKHNLAAYCVAMKTNGKWASYPCHTRMSIICKFRTKNVETAIRPFTKYWIGINRNSVRWSDETPVDYQAFSKYQDLPGDVRFCTYIKADLNRYAPPIWMQKPCKETLRAKICSRPAQQRVDLPELDSHFPRAKHPSRDKYYNIGETSLSLSKVSEIDEFKHSEERY